jgi:hypothetical protein
MRAMNQDNRDGVNTQPRLESTDKNKKGIFNREPAGDWSNSCDGPLRGQPEADANGREWEWGR